MLIAILIFQIITLVLVFFVFLGLPMGVEEVNKNTDETAKEMLTWIFNKDCIKSEMQDGDEAELQ